MEKAKMRRIAVVGAGSRAYDCYAEFMVTEFVGKAQIVGVYDINPVRSKVFKEKIGDECKVYDDFDKMLDTEKPDYVFVLTTDCTHHEYIVRALDKGYDVISEKPVTNTFERCKAIREAEKRSGHKVTVTFNCRYMPYLAKAKELLNEGRIGKVLAINYEYCLDRQHGGSYMQRWHRKMEFSQSLYLHKSTHHFDIVNWLVDDEPKYVSALANTVYYNDTSKSFAVRCYNCSKKEECESYTKLNEKLYLDAEKEDGYIVDKCSFSGDIDIYDNMSISVMYSKGALLTYSLNMFSEHEGYRMVVTGEKGMMILNVWYDETSDKDVIEFIFKNGTKEYVTFKKATGLHGGGDKKMIEHLFGLKTEDPLGQHAELFDGFASAMIGVCANESIKEHKTVDATKYLDQLR